MYKVTSTTNTQIHHPNGFFSTMTEAAEAIHKLHEFHKAEGKVVGRDYEIELTEYSNSTDLTEVA